ncbi:peptide/nickel transport system ATP-binding protein [Pseudomonas nitritireducens]|uniref:ABC-type dipeptide transporter n=1 Tax=Pseudomonas nitroreducens TaxID=46680 RepID=A0A7W7KLU8_PSENT|nr:ABC transporter ATP-binding protein [Pseudomonas nitritireducens]MBB4864901.1 peptide/nickel transport system ATP-binding protein [Pseudomonas nitritireducens]
MSEPLLKITGLRIEAGGADGWNEIVHGIDLQLQRGRILGLVGESGAGKSTIGLAAMGYTRDGCRISGGEILFDGIDLRQVPESQHRELLGARIAYVAQSAAASFNPAHRLIDQHCESALEHGLAAREQARRDAVELYRKISLPEPESIGERYPHQVSGGQLQRIMTAMAMSCRPDLIIFDEPTTALDVTTQIDVLLTIRELVREFQVAAIYISHDLAVVAQMADEVMVLKDGHLVERGDKRRLIAQPQADYTRSLWAVRNLACEARPPVAADQKPLLELRGIRAGYGNKQVLDDVSLKVFPGRTLAIVGESGSGKSTLGRCITGALPAREGSLLFNGAPLAGHYAKRSRDDLRAIQMIYQMADTALNPRHRIGDIVGRPLQFYGGLSAARREERTRELLAAVGLEPGRFMARRPGELSGGQKQRVGIARALAADPAVIVCDEITSALDQLVAEGILRLIDDLKQSLGVTYLFITHDLSVVKSIADDVLVLKAGKVVDFGEKQRVFTPPCDSYVTRLLDSMPQMDPDWLDGLAHRGVA